MRPLACDQAAATMTAATRTRLEARLDGRLLVPGDLGDEKARAVWNAMIDLTPMGGVRVDHPSDQAAA
jgi:hypothetical protein